MQQRFFLIQQPWYQKTPKTTCQNVVLGISLKMPVFWCFISLGWSDNNFCFTSSVLSSFKFKVPTCHAFETNKYDHLTGGAIYKSVFLHQKASCKFKTFFENIFLCMERHQIMISHDQKSCFSLFLNTLMKGPHRYGKRLEANGTFFQAIHLKDQTKYCRWWRIHQLSTSNVLTVPKGW